MKVWLCVFEGLVDPRIYAGPFDEKIPDEVIIKAMKEISKNGTELEDLLFGLSVHLDFKSNNFDLRLWAFEAGYMEDLQERIEKERKEEDQ